MFDKTHNLPPEIDFALFKHDNTDVAPNTQSVKSYVSYYKSIKLALVTVYDLYSNIAIWLSFNFGVQY
jgi:hypothetical protein